MEPEITTSVGNKKKFVIAFAVILVVAGVALGYLFMQKDTPEQMADVATFAQEKKVYTQEEKEQILAQLALGLPKGTVSQAEKEAILRNLSKKLPADTLSREEKLRILSAIASSTKQ